MSTLKNTLIQITQEGMGNGDNELGLLLLKNYLSLLSEENERPRVIAFYNAGVKLLANGSPLVRQFKDLENAGIRLVACKTCLKHYNLLDQIEVGIQGTMIDIMELQKVANKVVNL
ncbi:DsrE family protein [Mangrovibacterium sp.]|uniref:DsrE family protein n=1 Tax=Mangrovibacterium sp. TaxID=1961364 RepID=UPI003563AD2E